MVKPTVIDLTSVQVKYYSFIVSLDESSEGWNTSSYWSTKTCSLIKTEHVNVKTFNIITRSNEAKTMVRHVSCYCKCKCNITAFKTKILKWI